MLNNFGIQNIPDTLLFILGNQDNQFQNSLQLLAQKFLPPAPAKDADTKLAADKASLHLVHLPLPKDQPKAKVQLQAEPAEPMLLTDVLEQQKKYLYFVNLLLKGKKFPDEQLPPQDCPSVLLQIIYSLFSYPCMRVLLLHQPHFTFHVLLNLFSVKNAQLISQVLAADVQKFLLEQCSSQLGGSAEAPYIQKIKNLEH